MDKLGVAGSKSRTHQPSSEVSNHYQDPATIVVYIETKFDIPTSKASFLT